MVCISSLELPESVVLDRTYDRVSFLDDLVRGDQGLERLDFIGQDWLDAQSRPERDGGVVIPGVYDAFWKADTISRRTCPLVSPPLTSDVFLFRSALFRAGGLLNVDYQFALRFVLVDRPGRIVDFIIFVRIRSWASSPSRRPPKRAESV